MFRSTLPPYRAWHKRVQDFIIFVPLFLLLGLARCLPETIAIKYILPIRKSMIFMFKRIYKTRIETNIAIAFPDYSLAKRSALRQDSTLGVPPFLSVYFPRCFAARALAFSFSGDGVSVLERAYQNKRPVIFISGHFGNPYVFYRAVNQRYPQWIEGALTRPLNNVFIDTWHARCLQKSVQVPFIPTNAAGLRRISVALQQGHAVIMLFDVAIAGGAELSFFGHRALTSLLPAKLALKHNALLLPFYSFALLDNGSDNHGFIESPIAHTTPEQMMQAFNDRLEAHIRQAPELWFWLHRRWK